MPTTDPRVDAAIAKAAPSLKPVLEHLRALVHQTCPEVTETIKWGMPFFDYQGLLANMPAFKAHCAFGFWKAGQMKDVAFFRDNDAAGSLGRITSLKDLPPDKKLVGWIKEAMALNESGAPSPMQKRAQRKPPKAPTKLPAALAAVLGKDAKLKAAFAKLAPGHQREYVDWIAEAKQDATRDRRLAQLAEWVLEGKSRNWKYQNR